MKGVGMGTKIAIFHVFSAVIVVWVMDFAVRQATGSAPSDYRMVKLASYASIAVIGAWMLWSTSTLYTRGHVPLKTGVHQFPRSAMTARD